MFTLMVVDAGTGGAAELAAHQPAMLAFCGMFFREWLVGFLNAIDRWAYLKKPQKVLYLLSSIPVGYLFGTLRIVQLYRVLRVLWLLFRARAFRGRGRQLVQVFGVTVATAFAGALALRLIEPRTTDSFSEALLWALVTITTVGYGDIVPLTSAGRWVASVLLVSGVGVFGYVAGFLGNMMVDPEEDEILRKVRALREELRRAARRSGARQRPRLTSETLLALPDLSIDRRGSPTTRRRGTNMTTVNKPEWNGWMYDKLRIVLIWSKPHYEVDVEQCRTSAHLLDWIFQVETKGWADDACIAGLIRALSELLDPQATLCSNGIEQGPIDVKHELKLEGLA